MGPLSVLDIFKIGIGPSSSHTMGPWKAALLFNEEVEALGLLDQCLGIQIELFGSLALTGQGHGTDIAILLGLTGEDPRTIDPPLVQSIPAEVRSSSTLLLAGKRRIAFNNDKDITFHYGRSLDFHSNGLRFYALGVNRTELYSATYFSVGGGFVSKEGEPETDIDQVELPFPITRGSELEAHCVAQDCGIAGVVSQNEKAWRSDQETEQELLAVWHVMKETMFRGSQTKGVLPGGLDVRRRAAELNTRLLGESGFSSSDDWIAQIREREPSFGKILKWISCFAMATNEENAAFGRVVTAPTNGAAGVIPAVMMYLVCFGEEKVDNAMMIKFLMVAGEIGCLFKKRATISAAMGGCQAEIGVSSAMAAAALAECMGGSVGQALMAAEIAMEHHLGLTCDPVGGLVQVPCIERNTMGAIKAITAAKLAIESDPEEAKVSLDDVIKTMWNTAVDMNTRYKETSLGGLAVNISVIEPEC